MTDCNSDIHATCTIYKVNDKFIGIPPIRENI